ncbi:hypothetical protein Pla123a_04390 [Posidoniimonas polymericola]|uniref:Uncharacterized protein n=1 Tax=Posidoniimonas polymericola TaxID=2528002 RepID=A0A5C5ZE86_9BACT|nr:hypothetical protein [Posidoniimonas polymericola]TWT85632.1 hypothetical protein Pla123a_04390 [Posidoniimonas polymericola]
MIRLALIGLALLCVSCNGDPAERRAASVEPAIDRTGKAIYAEFKSTIGQDNVVRPTPLYREVAEDDSYWESETGFNLYRKVMIELSDADGVWLNFLHWQAPKISGLQEAIKDGMAAYVSEGQTRAYVADLYEHVPVEERDLSYMFYAAFADSHCGVRRNLLYQIPTDRLNSNQMACLLNKANDEDEWYFARIGAAWALAAAGNESGVLWAQSQKEIMENKEHQQLLDQVLQAAESRANLSR